MIALKGRVEREGSTSWKWTGRWCFGTEFDEGPRVASMPFCYTWERPVSPEEIELPLERGVDYDMNTEDGDAARENSPNDTNSNEGAMESQGDDQEPDNIANECTTDLQEVTKPPVKNETNHINNEKKEEAQDSLEESNEKNMEGSVENIDESSSNMDQKDDSQSGLPNEDTKVSKLETPASHLQEAVSDNVQNDKVITPTTPRRRTFADKANPDDPDFTDAATQYANECPPSGGWKGYFETTVGRKKPQAMPVSESFSLFLNATPAPGARACFTDDMMIVAAKTVETPSTPGGLLPLGLIHVRGTGENQYGLFELIGSLNKETGIMQCQRLYYPLPQKQIRSRKRRKSFTSDSVDASRPTRKRQLSWKKRDSHEPEAEPRRPRTSFSTQSPSSKKKVIDDVSDAPPIPDTAAMVAMTDSAASAITPVALKLGGNLHSRKPSVVPSKRLQPNSASRNRIGTQKNSSSIASGAVVKLPSLGDATAARWRAAHYLYYQKPQPPSDEAGNGTTNKSPTGHQQAKYVIYEGDMYNSQRHGKGICLYTNGLLYEGEWFQDKEHGAGTIMSSDRKRIIYKGDFTYGKIHGAGIYYYYQTPYRRNTNKKTVPQPPTIAERVSRYEGEFKEMLRHGNGTYYLPDGSVYSGQFRDNQFFGRGTFTWPDSSVYDGEWKDGKRHGLGALRSSDGFTYDGNWVNNAMDGRGSAVYPGGQAYNGLFSNGRREGRGTITFTNGAIYEGRFRDDLIDGQGTMKMGRIMVVPDGIDMDNGESCVVDEKEENGNSNDEKDDKKDFMIPLSFQSDMGHIHRKAGFTMMGE